MPLTVTPDLPIALMRLHVDYVATAGTQLTADLYRGLSATGPWEFIRSLDLLGQEAYTVDNTMPLDTPVWYRTVADTGDEFIDGPETITTVGGAGWIRDPGRPWADLELTVCEQPDPFCDPADALSWVGFEDFASPTDASLTEILDSEKPADVWARRKHLVTGIRFLSRTLDMMRRVYELFTAGGPLFLQLPPEYGWDDDFFQTTADVNREYISRDQSRPWRRWTAPIRTSERPQGPIQGAICSNWCDVNSAFATYADFTAAAGDWGDVAEGTVQC